MVTIAVIFFTACFQQISWHPASSSEITLLKCNPPDFPEFGSYGPQREKYDPGDIIHYYCDTDYFMGGNYQRICLDSGDWSGDTPVCDAPAIFSKVEQSSTEDRSRENGAHKASDGDRTTCSKTLGETNGATWTGTLKDFAREALRFMLYLPKGPVSYEVFILRSDGSQVSCGKSTKTVVMHEWAFHNCMPPHHTNVNAVMVKSLTNRPLEICEIVVHTLTDPSCADPHFEVDNGRLKLTRKTASLVCNEGYIKWDGSRSKLDCIRTGVWSRRNLFCEDPLLEPRIPDGDEPFIEGRPI